MATDICYPDGADWSCALGEAEIEALNEELKERAEALAWSTLSALTAYRVALCPTVARPCAARCLPPTYFAAPVVGGPFDSGTFSPYMLGGSWYNACGCRSIDSCSCSVLSEVLLPSTVGGIVSVVVDGVEIPSSQYRVDNFNRLIRTDGGVWPLCQDMASDDAFVVTYYSGVAPNDLLRYAAGLLAYEFYQACGGQKCRLPQGVTTISRNGITMEIPSGLFPNGATGIHQVDTIIRLYNPHGLKTQSRVLSPDRPTGRITTGA
jgi:hypothetical protein